MPLLWLRASPLLLYERKNYRDYFMHPRNTKPGLVEWRDVSLLKAELCWAWSLEGTH
jgi:hypothetical protein